MSVSRDMSRTWSEELEDSPKRAVASDWGLLLLRLVVGLLFAGHGARKLLGWFGGPGIQGWEDTLASIGYKPAYYFALAHASAELVGGLLLVFGLLTPFAAAALLGVMINAISIKLGAGLWVPNGFEYEVILATLGAMFAITGPGTLSADRPFPWARGGAVSGTIGIVLGSAAGAAASILPAFLMY